MSLWNLATLDVTVDYDDFQRAHDDAIKHGEDCDHIRVEAEVDIDEALEHATVVQLRSALSRELPDYTEEQLSAIRDCFAAARSGDSVTAAALLSRVFEHDAQRMAAEAGLGVFCTRIAA